MPMEFFKGPIEGRTLHFHSSSLINENEACCEDLWIHNTQKEKIISYFPQTREYGFKVNKTIFQRINFCPWCGFKFLPSLRDEFFNLTDCLLTQGADIEVFDNPELPTEFKTDEWWKKRRL